MPLRRNIDWMRLYEMVVLVACGFFLGALVMALKRGG